MRRALEIARRTGRQGDVPVGALLVDGEGSILAEAGNGTARLNDPTAHAEILVLREAGSRLAVPRLPGTTIYVTLEPCLMCLGAMVQARISRLVFAADDPKVGATRLLARILATFHGLNHRFVVEGGALADQAAALLQTFFRDRR